MILWTIQEESSYGQLINTGVYRADASLIFDEYYSAYKMHYDWLIGKMKLLIGNPPDGVEYPIWAWHTWEGKRKRRDLRCRGYGTRGKRKVQMEIEIPDTQVLLTDFDLWCAMMNGFNLNISTETDLDKDYADLHSAMKSNNYDLFREQIIKSWDKCIGCNQCYNELFMCKKRSVQATFWELKKNQIRKVWHFTCR